MSQHSSSISPLHHLSYLSACMSVVSASSSCPTPAASRHYEVVDDDDCDFSDLLTNTLLTALDSPRHLSHSAGQTHFISHRLVNTPFQPTAHYATTLTSMPLNLGSRCAFLVTRRTRPDRAGCTLLVLPSTTRHTQVGAATAAIAPTTAHSHTAGC